MWIAKNRQQLITTEVQDEKKDSYKMFFNIEDNI